MVGKSLPLDSAIKLVEPLLEDTLVAQRSCFAAQVIVFAAYLALLLVLDIVPICKLTLAIRRSIITASRMLGRTKVSSHSDSPLLCSERI